MDMNLWTAGFKRYRTQSKDLMKRQHPSPANFSTDGETGVIRKPWHSRVRVALVYPNRYHVGMSNLGFQTVYAMLNALDEVVCERAFFPEPAAGNTPGVKTVESERCLTDFHIIAFSVSFENDFPNILKILRLAKIPLTSEARGDQFPMIIAGGVACFLNPEPLAPFMDLFVIGEAENILHRFIALFDPILSRSHLLKLLATSLPAIYVPSFYRPVYSGQGTLERVVAEPGVPEKIQRVHSPNLSSFSTCTSILTSDTAFDFTHLLEISRGCARGCRFCAAGFVYRPVRYRALSFLEDNIRQAAPGIEKIGLVGAAISDFPGIEPLCETSERAGIRLSFSSIRADTISTVLLKALSASRTKTVAIAPDAGSQRLRNVINKNLSEDIILEAAEKLVDHGIPNLKLYFMVGLPTETREDVEEIVTLCKRIKHVFLRASRAKTHIGVITVSLNCFVPKPFTPFQWVPMDSTPSLKEKIKQVQHGLKRLPNTRVHADMPRWAYIQALLSRGDRKVSGILAALDKHDQNWPRTLKESFVNPDFYVLRERSKDEAFPWDILEHGISRSFLWDEYQRALNEKLTPPCAPEKCRRCGICG
jgi:radical SAM family uncharacterized protein